MCMKSSYQSEKFDKNVLIKCTSWGLMAFRIRISDFGFRIESHDFQSSGLREQVRIIVGGAPVNEQVRKFTGADYYAEDAVAGINLCKEICS
jgi:hypothetical protein